MAVTLPREPLTLMCWGVPLGYARSSQGLGRGDHGNMASGRSDSVAR